LKKKEFNLHDNHDAFFNTNTQQANKFDFESSSFVDYLFEYEKTFPPSYPYSEQHHEARSYLRARCPAWCDRILLSHSFKDLVDTKAKQPTYDIIGYDVCVGDHKPVYLSLTIGLKQDVHENTERLKTLTFATDSKSNKVQLLPTMDNNDDQRIVLAHHVFHANIKHTIVRFIRETPV